ncbi:MAG: LLM class flavin-dependent oxidoreductase [Flavobacteriaceae bacterium]
MKIGVTMGMTQQPGVLDADIYKSELYLADLVEPLGYDSLWALEHHFTGYQMSPNPLALLNYFAGRTRRIQLGSAVVVLPWHDPIRVAEEMALLDILSGGRCLFGVGRGSGSVEYEGFRIPMEEARPRFTECAQIIRMGLKEESFEWDGEFYKIPRTSIRPRPISSPEKRIYASSVSPESAEMMAKLGFGMLMIMQNEWTKASQDVVKYNEMAAANGFTPPAPILLVCISTGASASEAEDRALKYLPKKWDDVDAHYKFSDGHLGKVKGYESYGNMAKTYSKLAIEEERKKAADFYVKIQVVGTPDECIQQIEELRRLTGMDHLIVDFNFGSMPVSEAEQNMRMFAENALPVIHRDMLFRSEPPKPGLQKNGSDSEGRFFVPA